jgi:hypothetical protein
MNFKKCIDFARFFCFMMKNDINFQIISYYVEIFECYFLYYKLQLFLEQYIHRITFTCCKRLMNFKQTLIFHKQKIEEIWKSECFLYVSNNNLFLKKLTLKKIVLWKLKGPLWK